MEGGKFLPEIFLELTFQRAMLKGCINWLLIVAILINSLINANR